MPDGEVALEQIGKLGRVSRHQCITTPCPYLRCSLWGWKILSILLPTESLFFSLLHPCPNLSSSSGFPCSCSEFCGLVLLPGSGEAKQGHRELLNDSCLSVNLWIWRWVFLAVRNGLQTACQEVQQRCWHLKAIHPDQVVSWKMAVRSQKKCWTQHVSRIVFTSCIILRCFCCTNMHCDTAHTITTSKSCGGLYFKLQFSSQHPCCKESYCVWWLFLPCVLTICCGVASWHCFWHSTNGDWRLSGGVFFKVWVTGRETKEGSCLNRNGSHGFVTAYGRDTCRNEFSAVLPVTISRLRRHVRTEKMKHSFSFYNLFLKFRCSDIC